MFGESRHLVAKFENLIDVRQACVHHDGVRVTVDDVEVHLQKSQNTRHRSEGDFWRIQMFVRVLGRDSLKSSFLFKSQHQALIFDFSHFEFL